MTENLPESISVQLQQKIKGEEVWSNYSGTDAEPGTVTLSTDNKWKYKWNNLPEKNNEEKEYLYRVQEISVPGYTVSYDNNDGIISGGITITNTQQSYVLPESGGPGTKAIRWTGFGLLLASLTLLFMRKRSGSRS